MAKSKRTGIIVRITPGKKGKWETFAYTKQGSKLISFTAANNKRYTGPFKFGNRLIARNGYLTADNSDFNTPAAAYKNIASVKASA